MSYSRKVYDAAVGELARRRREAEGCAAALRERAMRRDPHIADLCHRIAGGTAQVARLVMEGGDPTDCIRRIEQDNLAAQEELKNRLHALGETADSFDPQYTCPACSDTGYVGRKMCGCFSALLAAEARKELCGLTGMKMTRFEDMDLGFYEDKEQMAGVLEYCRCYGADFGTDADSLLLYGPTGTGKTHAALALAALAAERGFSVVYGPVQQLLRRLEREHFGREDGDSEDTLVSCDLLILDDLGTELTTPFYISALYNIINGRLLAGLPTVISTNLSPADWHERYGEQIASRVLGTYQPLRFVGSDIRQAKLERSFRA